MPRKQDGPNDRIQIPKDQLSMLTRHLGAGSASKAGFARAANLTPKQRSNIASKAANARWQIKGNINKNENPLKTYG